jgi:CspA family cold shock protein
LHPAGAALLLPDPRRTQVPPATLTSTMSDFDRSSHRPSRRREREPMQDTPPPRFPSSQPRFQRPGRDMEPIMPSGDPVRGTVKWFNSGKGFGFVTLEDGADVFLHSSVMMNAGATVNEGDLVRVRVGQGQKGLQVTEILDVEPSAGGMPVRGSPRPPGPPRQSGPLQNRGPAVDIRGTVKWYNQQKGFGFIRPEDGTKDVFVHASTLARAGLDQLPEGTRVAIKVVQGAKGPEATEIGLD